MLKEYIGNKSTNKLKNNLPYACQKILRVHKYLVIMVIMFQILNWMQFIFKNFYIFLPYTTGSPTCPWLNQMASTTPSTALSRSADSNTTTGDFPPSSSDSFLPLPAVSRRRVCPTWQWNQMTINPPFSFQRKVIYQYYSKYSKQNNFFFKLLLWKSYI